MDIIQFETSDVYVPTDVVNSEETSLIGQPPFNRRSTFAIPRLGPPIQRPTSDTDFLTRLSSWVQPGLYAGEFHGLMGRMAECSCGMVMMRNVFNEHRCEGSVLRPIKKARLE